MKPILLKQAEIQDTAVKHLTQAKCTNEHPCDVDQAPVCKAIKYGQYEVDSVKYDWVSTYSYRGWCGLLKLKLKACDQQRNRLYRGSILGYLRRRSMHGKPEPIQSR